MCRCSDVLFFFFKQETAYEMRISDWSSDVCSSDLRGAAGCHADHRIVSPRGPLRRQRPAADGRARPDSRRCRVLDQRGAEIQGPADQLNRERRIVRRYTAKADRDQGSEPNVEPEFKSGRGARWGRWWV